MTLKSLDLSRIELEVASLEKRINEVVEVAREQFDTESEKIAWPDDEETQKARETRLAMLGNVGILCKWMLEDEVKKIKICLKVAREMESKLEV